MAQHYTIQPGLFDDDPEDPALTLTVPSALGPRLRVGTCSWKYPSWAGLVYDPSRSYRPDEFLSDYAKQLNTVEIDQWFWSLYPDGVRLPDPDTVAQYVDSVPEDFVFTVKAPNALTLTHYAAKQSAHGSGVAGQPNDSFLDPSVAERFLASLGVMHRQLGVVMLQFGYLNRSHMPSNAAFLETLDRFLSCMSNFAVTWGVETRNPQVLTPALGRVLSRHSAASVLIQGYYMPRIDTAFGDLGVDSACPCVLRLMGPDRADIEARTGTSWDRIVDARDEELAATVRVIRQRVDAAAPTYVNVNNHFEGSAPRTIDRLIQRLERACSE